MEPKMEGINNETNKIDIDNNLDIEKTEENLNINELKEKEEELNKKIDELEKNLQSIEQDIFKLQEQLPKFDGKFVDREYSHFVEGLGKDFDKKIETLISMERDMSNDFVYKNMEGIEKDNLSKSIKAMHNLIDDLKNKKTNNENYDNQQFIKLTRGVFDIIIEAYKNLGYIRKYNQYIDKYLEEQRGLNEYKAKVESDPENIRINKEISELGKTFQEKTKDKQSMQIERNEINDKINNLEGNK